jgi:hypothetical protein
LNARLEGKRDIVGLPDFQFADDSPVGRMASLLRGSLPGVQFNAHLTHPGDIVFAHACKMGLEGIVSKRLGSRHLKRLLPQVIAIKLQEIEGNEHDLRVVAAMPQLVKARHPALVAAHCLTVDQAAAHLQSPHSLEDERVASAQSCPSRVSSRMPTDRASSRAISR